jgi:hypothetical protein
MELNGIPLHPLVVHAAVVFVPLAALTGLLYGLVPRWRWVVRWPMVVAGLVGAGCVQLAAMSGDDLMRRLGIHSALLDEHEMWAGRLQLGAWVLAGLILVAWWAMPVVTRVVGGRDRIARLGVLTPVLPVVLPLAALVEVYLVVRTGDAGAKLVWAGR